MKEPQPDEASSPSAHSAPAADVAAEGGASRVLVIRLGDAADVVLALPVLHALRESFPDAEIGWLVEAPWAEILEGHPELSRLHVLPTDEWRQLGWWKRRRLAREFGESLRSCSYTVAVDVGTSPKSARLAAATEARIRIGYAAPAGQRSGRRDYTHRVSPGPELDHVVARNLSLLIPLGVTRSEPRFVYPDLSDTVERLAEPAGGQAQAPTRGAALIHPDAEWASGRWPVEHYAELARRVVSELDTLVVVMAFGERERPRAEAVARAAGEGGRDGGVRSWSFGGPREFAAFAREAALFVGGDTGAVHIAWSVGAPTVAILGPTVGAGRDPLGPLTRSVDAGLGCSGCGKPRCPDGTRACMRSLKPEAVFEAVCEVVSGHEAPAGGLAEGTQARRNQV